ncbi:MAG: aspartate kinase [Bacteroidia bacterium]|nr:aspartate kinase [Bacteroidia bacterium]
MEIFKFGGASILDKDSIKNVADIIQTNSGNRLLVVVSAKGKTTNKLEEALAHLRNNNLSQAKSKLDDIVDEHLQLGRDLGITSTAFIADIQNLRSEADLALQMQSQSNLELYDRIVSFGELLSTKVIYHYLISTESVGAEWLDIRSILKTDNNHTEAKVLWKETKVLLDKKLNLMNDDVVIITQGFIGSTLEGKNTTLGREGSDYSASILAYLLDLDKVTIWKDVPGILTADPRLFDNVNLIPKISYKEAIEMTYYGAKVIHPKTIKPLQNKGIQLIVRSFRNPTAVGTVIGPEEEGTLYPPIVVVEKDQSLIRFSTLDFSFIAEEHLSEIFDVFDRHRIKVNMMRNGAISFSVCVTNKSDKVHNIINDLESKYQISVDNDLELLTIRQPKTQLIEHLQSDKLVLFKEIVSDTVRMVTKPIEMIRRKSRED